jgi:hypothetical protein
MTQTEAEDFARTQAREHPDRHTHRWMVKEQPDGSWTVAKVRMPPGTRIDPLKTTTEAKPKPPQPDDPRTSYDRSVGGPWVG